MGEIGVVSEEGLCGYLFLLEGDEWHISLLTLYGCSSLVHQVSEVGSLGGCWAGGERCLASRMTQIA